jgi:hypothetical protein
MGEYALHELVRRIPALTPSEHEGLLGGNAMRLLGLDTHHPALQAAQERRGARR